MTQQTDSISHYIDRNELRGLGEVFSEITDEIWKLNEQIEALQAKKAELFERQLLCDRAAYNMAKRSEKMREVFKIEK